LFFRLKKKDTPFIGFPPSSIYPMEKYSLLPKAGSMEVMILEISTW